MKFLCDVHISIKFSKYLSLSGFHTLHVNQILDKWLTTDSTICRYVDENDFVLISKDSDFKDSHFLKNSPRKLIKINLGNISNEKLISVFREILPELAKLERHSSFIIEIDTNRVIFKIPNIE